MTRFGTDASGGNRSGARLAVGGILGTGLLAALVGCGLGQAEEAPIGNFSEVVRIDLEINAEAAGEVEPLRRVDVMSKASGEVLEVLVDIGDRVEAGALLARIDPRDVRNEFNQAEADYEVARERYAIAEAQLHRSENLLRSGVITEQEHEGRNLEYANARATLVRAETSMELARLRLDDVTIRAPLAGVVLQKNVEEGQVITSPAGNVSGGTVLLTIADLDRVQVRTLVNETDVGRIEPGMPVTVRVDAHQDRAFQGHVEKIEPQARVEQNVVNFPVIVHLDNEEGLLRPGMSANATILVARRPGALSLPNNAIVSFNEMAQAASVLGVPSERLQLDPSAFQGLLRERPGVAEGEGERGPGRGGPGGDGPAVVRRPGSGDAFGGDGQAGRQGIVFVQEADGTLSPRPVLVGVTDWSNSEILAGLEEGERVAVLGGSQLQTQQGGFRGMRIMGGGFPF